MWHEAKSRGAIHHRLTNDLPITLDQTKWMYTQWTSWEFDDKKRCNTCNGEGTVKVTAGAIEKFPKCCDCDGKGYE